MGNDPRTSIISAIPGSSSPHLFNRDSSIGDQDLQQRDGEQPSVEMDLLEQQSGEAERDSGMAGPELNGMSLI